MKNFRFFLIPFFLFSYLACTQSQNNSYDVWKTLPHIIENITRPDFPDYEVNITDFGAVGNGTTDCTESFKKAIDNCSDNGGGKVVVPEGTFLTGAIHLRSNVNLFLSENSVIKFSTIHQKYLPVVFTRWEGVECMNYSPLIYAYEQKNIAITGTGILDGQGSDSFWWSWKGKPEFGWKEGMPEQKSDRDKLFEMAENNIPPSERIFGDGHFLRPNFFQPYKCKNILVEGVTFINSPMWFLHPVLCENVSIINVTVTGLGPNNDGCDPESSKNVLIEGCTFNNGDDCIAIKSGRNNDGRRVNVPGENIIIRNCKMKDGHGGVVIGSEISGGVKNVFAENCEMNSPELDRAIRIKTNAVRGGTVENIYVRNIEVGEVKEAVIKINYYYEEGENGSFVPVVKNIFLSHITSEKSKYAVWIKAFKNSPVENINIEDCIFNNVADENFIQNVSEFNIDSVLINGAEWKFIN